MTSVLVIQNTVRGGIRRFGEWLTASGAELTVVPAYAGVAPPKRLGERALVVLGGGYLPDEDSRAPWLAATRALAAEALEHGRPYFGICLGGQLLAHVAGGTVQGRHGTPEVGSTPLLLRPEAATDALFADLPARVSAVERHVDAITALPDGASWLMHSEHCLYQAFRVGERAWGVQFHPEVGAAQVRDWERDGLREYGLDPDEVYRQADQDEAASWPVWHTVAGRFAQQVEAS